MYANLLQFFFFLGGGLCFPDILLGLFTIPPPGDFRPPGPLARTLLEKFRPSLVLQ